MTSDQLVIHEIARVALAFKPSRDEIGLTLDLSDEEINRIEQIVAERLNMEGYAS